MQCFFNGYKTSDCYTSVATPTHPHFPHTMEKPQLVDRYREEGNQLYAKGQYQEAVQSYSRAIRAFLQAAGEETALDEEEQAQRQSNPVTSFLVNALDAAFTSLRVSTGSLSNLSSTATATAPSSKQQQPQPSTSLQDMQPHLLYSNRSAAQLHLRRFTEAFQDAEKATMLRPDWYKGFYRKAEALLALRRYEDALPVFHQCLERVRAGVLVCCGV